MATDVLSSISTRHTAQSEQADERQVVNNAGGYTFELADEQRLRRFLVLGTDGGTYYTLDRDLTKDNASVVFRMCSDQHTRLVDVITEISVGGRAPKANPALFALAVAASMGTAEEKRYALSKLWQVARTGTHLFLFARYVEQFRGWGRGLRKAVGDWYLDKPVQSLAYQAVKYQQREGWSHRDLLRLASPPHWHSPNDPAKTLAADPPRRALFDWICRGDVGEHTPRLIEGFLKANENDERTSSWARLIDEYGLSWEMLPDRALNLTTTWDALLGRGVPQTALMKQLPRLTRIGLLAPLGPWAGIVADQLADPARLKRARVHPVNVLVAARTYASGYSAKGDSTWQPVAWIVDALDEAFYVAFGAVEPSGKRTRLALDVSGSMHMTQISNLPITPREASAALALVTAATEPAYDIVGFTSKTGRAATWGDIRTNCGLTPLAISPRQRLDDAIRTVSDLPFGGTDCALPMIDALEKGLEIDTFVIYTDNETWHGDIHPHQALRQYRERSGIDAKLIVVGMTATEFTIADPTDTGMLDVAGFDSAVPTLISDFSRGL